MNTEYSKKLANEFYLWEERCKGILYAEYPVKLEPVYTPIVYSAVRRQFNDDGRLPTVFEQISNLFKKRSNLEVQKENFRPVSKFTDTSPIHILHITVSKHYKLRLSEFEEFLISLSNSSSLLSFEIIGSNTSIIFQIVCRKVDLLYVKKQFQLFLPECVIAEAEDNLFQIFKDNLNISTLDFSLKEEFIRCCQTPKSLEQDSLLGLIALLESLGEGQYLILQILFSRTNYPWHKAIANAVLTHNGDSIFKNAPEMVPMAKEKIGSPLFAVTIRIACKSKNKDHTFLFNRLESVCIGISKSSANCLKSNTKSDYNKKDLFDDILFRRSHRLGMILNSKELINFVHLPSGSLNSSRIIRNSSRTKALPGIAKGHSCIIGINAHQGKETFASLSEAQKALHVSISGSTGMGKSNLLLHMVRSEIDTGNGTTVIDPHGDLIDRILAYIPEHRIKDVIIIDPADEEHPIGLNILKANSEIEKTVLASDLVAAFRKNSQTWGDQMNSIFANSILAFLENDKGGTLSDIRRYLVEKRFRDTVLQNVHDPSVVYYWQHEFPFIKGNAIAPILTRLDTFLRPKVIRNMISQKEGLDFENIMDSQKILLVKLSSGLIGSENSYLLGSFIITKLQQAAMARQTKKEEFRKPHFLYIDEFANMTTSGISQIISGARKYGLSLNVAYQSLHVLQKVDANIANEIIANVGTKIYFKLGEADANKISEGFSFFKSEDFQNLSLGEAIGKINTSENDFSFHTLQIEESKIPSTVKQKIIDNSRKLYCRCKREVEQEIQQGLQLKCQKMYDPKNKKTDVRLPGIEPPPGNGQNLIKSQEDFAATTNQIFESLIKKKQDTQHRYLQTLIKKKAEAMQYKATSEWLIPNERGRVDVVLEKEHEKIAIEICITTTKEWELHNLKKNLAIDFTTIISCSPDKHAVDEFKDYVQQHLTIQEFSIIRFYTPEELFFWLEQKQTVNVKAETKTKGYMVKVEYEALSESEMKQKRNSVARVILDAKRKRNKTE